MMPGVNTSPTASSHDRRVSVDLSDFYQDHRKYCMVYLDDIGSKSIRDLKKYLTLTFELGGSTALLLDECLLLDKSSINLLRDGDRLRLIDLSKPRCATERDHHQLQVSSSPTKNGTGEKDALSNLVGISKPKPCSNGVIQIKKGQLSTSESSSSNDEKEKSGSVKNAPAVNQSPESTAAAKRPVQPAADAEGGEEVIATWDLAPVPKRKRVRKRRPKKKAVEETPAAVPTSAASCSATTSSNYFPVSKDSTRKHIRFDLPEEQEEESMEVATTTNSSLCHQQNYTHSKSLPNTAASVPENEFSALLNRNKPLIIVRNQPPKSMPQIMKQKRDWECVQEGELWTSPILDRAPKKDEIIAFKVLCLDDNYTPQLSDWLIAVVTSEEGDTHDTTILDIIRGTNPKLRKPGKLDLEDAVDDLQTESIISIEWKEMCVPRILSSE